MKRGYFGIGIYQPKTVENVGTLWRSAYQMGASFIFIIGERWSKYKRRLSYNADTCKSPRHIPLYEYESYEDFKKNRPMLCQLVGIEFCERSVPIANFVHPQQCIYLLGSEDGGLPKEVMDDCQHILELPSIRTPSYNVAVAGSLVMYDRQFVK